MSTYDYKCQTCGHEESVSQSIGDYVRNPLRPVCQACFPRAWFIVKDDPDFHVDVPYMERCLSVNPAMSGLANALAGDRHYDGMRHSDGTDISSRKKHRDFMKSRGYTTADDFKDTWAKAEKERVQRRMGEAADPDVKKIITEQVMRAVAQSD